MAVEHRVRERLGRVGLAEEHDEKTQEDGGHGGERTIAYGTVSGLHNQA
jgi:hypothetical protein